MTKKLPLAGKKALVTGGSRGIGFEIAREFVEAGAAVIITGRIRENLQSASAVLKSLENREVYEYAFDIADPNAVAETIGEIVTVHGRIDILVNNAGSTVCKPVADMSVQEWSRIIDVNLSGAFYCTKAVLPCMLGRGEGIIINVASVAAVKPFPGNGAYGAAKAGLRMLTQVLREEVRDSGIRVSIVLPGATSTDLWRGAGDEFDRAVMIKPQSIARAVREICLFPGNALIEEIIIRPQGGDL